MSDLTWIAAASLGMSAISLVGVVTLRLRAETLERWLLPLVAFAAGSLLGSAFFHLLPAGSAGRPGLATGAWIMAGFCTFLVLEQVLHWHHGHHATTARPVTWLILSGDALHNFLDGLAVAGAYLVDVHVGAMAWLATAAHEVPQELGDFAVLVHGGWSRRRALLWNLLSGLTFFAGALLAWGMSQHVDVTPLALFAAGNFLYIGASDLVPEMHAPGGAARALGMSTCFLAGLLLLYALALFEA